MKDIFLSYGSTILAIPAFVALAAVFEKMLLACDSEFAGIVAFYLTGGC